MIAEIGHALLWLAASCAALQLAGALVPRLGALMVPAAILQGWLWLLIAGCLVWLFQTTDLSVAGVAATTAARLPDGLKRAAIVVQEGGWLIAATAAVAWGGALIAFLAGRARPVIGAAGTLALLLTLGLLHAGPFDRLTPAPTEGAGFPADVRARLAGLAPPGTVVLDADFDLGQRAGPVTLSAVTPVAGPDSTGVLAAIRVGDTVLTPEWRETERPRAGFRVASRSLDRQGWLCATIAPAGARWRVRVTRWPA